MKHSKPARRKAKASPELIAAIGSRITRLSPNRRPGVLVRFYPQDILLINRVAQHLQTPRESYIKRAAIERATADAHHMAQPSPPDRPAVDKPKKKR